MKKITKPAEREEAVFYSDFSGKNLGDCNPPVEIKIEFNYGSKKDGAILNLHLDDDDIKPILELIKKNISEDFKKDLIKKIKQQEKYFEDSMQFRDWTSCDYTSNSLWFLRELLGISPDIEEND
jgi:hypothetical protein